MKVAELNTPELDYWVAKAEGWILDQENDDWIFHSEAIIGQKFYKPSTDWSQGGPIIEREHIWIFPFGRKWLSRCDEEKRRFRDMLADTPLIAAMRAFVASKFGEDVKE